MNERLTEIEKQIINLQEEKKNIYEELNKRQCKLENEITCIINQLGAKLGEFYACGGNGQYHIRIADNMSYIASKYFNVDELFGNDKIFEYVRGYQLEEIYDKETIIDYANEYLDMMTYYDAKERLKEIIEENF